MIAGKCQSVPLEHLWDTPATVPGGVFARRPLWGHGGRYWPKGYSFCDDRFVASESTEARRQLLRRRQFGFHARESVRPALPNEVVRDNRHTKRKFLTSARRRAHTTRQSGSPPGFSVQECSRRRGCRLPADAPGQTLRKTAVFGPGSPSIAHRYCRSNAASWLSSSE